MNKALIILTEGSQDAAFIYFVLMQNEFEDFKNKMIELPIQIKDIIENHVKEKYPDSFDCNYKTQMFLPYILTKKEGEDVHYFLIYSTEGKDNAKPILLKYLNAIFNKAIGSTNAIEIFSFAIIGHSLHSNFLSSLCDTLDDHCYFKLIQL